MSAATGLAPKLRSVKYVYELPPCTDDQEVPREIVFDNSLQYTIPGVPHKIVFKNRAVSSNSALLQAPQSIPSPPDSLYEKDSSSEKSLNRGTCVKDGGEFWTSRLVGAKLTQFPNLAPVSSRPILQSRLTSISCDTCGVALTKIVEVVCSAWALVLSCQTENQDVVFGYKGHNVSSCLPIRLRTDAPKLLRSLFNEVSEWGEASYYDASSQFLAPREDEDDAYSFRTAINFISNGPDTLPRSSTYELPSQSVAIVLECKIKEDICISARFDERVLSRELMRLLLHDLEHLIWQMFRCDADTKDITELEILSPASRRQLTFLNRPLYQEKHECVYDLFRRQASMRPHLTAVHAWDGSLTYRQLLRDSEDMAEYLQALGVQHETYVPIIFEKSFKSIIALMGVILAGGAVVPLDPSLPLARLHSIIEDVGASIVISSELHNDKVPGHIRDERRVVLSDKLLRSLTCGTSLIQTGHPDNALYVIFTSGSTGKPKGVVVTHKQFCSSCDGFRDAIQLTSSESRVLHYSSFAFDISMLETFWTLCTGSCLCIPSEGDRLNSLSKCISDLDINWAMLTPSVANLIDPQDVPSLKTLCFVGEALSTEVVDAWADHVKAINAYGPAECSILTIVSKPLMRGVENIPLGRPQNCAVWIVGRDGKQLMPFGAIGEIVVEGAIVARGYLGQKELTDAVFLERPEFMKGVMGTSSRFYKTGDLGRMNADGSIHFCGRKDSQVKINGQRVELGEVEQNVVKFLQSARPKQVYPVLDRFDVAVELLRFETEAPILIAFIALGSLSRKSSAEESPIIIDKSSNVAIQILSLTNGMTAALRESLPAYMVPKIILPCHYLPLAPSGKTNRKRLQTVAMSMPYKSLLGYVGLESSSLHDFQEDRSEKLDQSGGPLELRMKQYASMEPLSRSDLPKGMVAPQLSPVELTLRNIWAKVLKRPDDIILIDDDFFQLGGDSISAIKVVAACRQASLHVDVAKIFQNPTLGQMALVCQGNSSSFDSSQPDVSLSAFGLLQKDDILELREEASSQCGVSPETIEDIYPCTYMQEGLMVVNLTRPGAYTGRWIHRLPFDVDILRFKKACEAVHAASPILRTRFVATTSAGSMQAVVKEPAEWLTHHDVETYIAQDEANPMLPGASLNRFGLVTSKDKKTVHFIWTIHHMLYDGWSLAMLCRRINELYRDSAMKPVEDFRKFIAYTQHLNHDEATEFWKKELRDVTPSTFPCPQKPGHLSYARAVVRESVEIATAHSSGWTISTILRAAWAIMIGQYSQTDDVLFGATVSGRNAPLDKIENIEAPIIATVPVRLRLNPDSRLVDFLHYIQSHSSAMIPFEQTGIQRIQTLNDDTKRGCNFQNLLVVQAGGTWDDDEPLGKPLYREEFTTFPVTCEAWVQPDRVEFAIHVDEDVTSRVLVAEAIETVKVVLKQLVGISSDSQTKLEDVRFKEIPDNNSLGPMNPVYKRNNVPSCIHEMISTTAGDQPDHEAVFSSQDSLNYRDLDIISSRLASHLTGLGVGPTSLVPLCFEKSVWAIVASLAVLKAGAAFVPLEPSQPLTRLRDTVNETKARVVLMSAFHAKATDLGAIESVVVSRDVVQTLPAVEDISGEIRTKPTAAAYVIFTSGTSGKPKGVVISHSSFASSAKAHGSILRMSPTTRALQFSSYSFDASILEILSTLIHGGTVCVASEKERIEELSSFIQRANANWSLLTPSVARILRPIDVTALKTLVLGGETPDKTLISRWLNAGVQVFNAYGPTECSVIATIRHYEPGQDSLDINPRNIGFPTGCSTWIVSPTDSHLLLDSGETGELLIEGPTVGTAYLNDILKSDEAFIVNPEWTRTQSFEQLRRFYKTGDLVSREADKSLVYIGRKDLQVKIHGQRVELEEVEVHVLACAEVRQCVILHPAVGPFKGKLTAVVNLVDTFLGPSSFQAKTSDFNQRTAIIQSQLSKKLPSIMLPTIWLDASTVCMNAMDLPLTRSGKVNRRQILSWVEHIPAQEGTATDELSLKSIGTTPIKPEERPAYELACKVSSILGSEFTVAQEHSSGYDDIFLHSSGLDSLGMMSLMHFVFHNYKVRVSMQLLMDRETSIRTLARIIGQSSDNLPAGSMRDRSMDLLAEINRHDLQIAATQMNSHSPVRRKNQNNSGYTSAHKYRLLTILLTGASGFLGTQILRQLLERRDVGRVVVIGRGMTLEAAETRVIDAGRRALWWTDLHQAKLEVWKGDLSEPKLGLDLEQWNAMSDGRTIDAIIHNGAIVHWNQDYHDLEAVNVLSTVALLQIAAADPRLRLVYVSGGRQSVSTDEKDEDIAVELSNSLGYSQTKFVSEALVKRAAQRFKSGSSNLTVIRPGLVIGTLTEGVANSDDYIWRMAAACISMEMYNSDDTNAWLDLSDATTTAISIIDATFTPEPSTIYRLDDGMTWGSFWSVLEGMGYNLKPVTSAEWSSVMRSNLAIQKEHHPMWPLAHLLDSETMQWDVRLADDEVRAPPLQLMVAVRRNMEFLAKVGFVKRPVVDSTDFVSPAFKAFSRSTRRVNKNRVGKGQNSNKGTVDKS